MTATRTATRDQYDAATSDAHHRLQALIGHHAARTVPGDNLWLRLQLADLGAALNDGTARLCHHIGSAPTVVHGALWDRWRLVCSTCISHLMPSTAEDTTCDRCRRHTTTIHPGAATAGPLLLAFGLCTRCARRTGLTNP